MEVCARPVVSHHLVNRLRAKDARIPVRGESGAAVGISSTPLEVRRRLGPAAHVTRFHPDNRSWNAAEHVVGEDELVPGGAISEGRPEPVELRGAEGPAPLVARLDVVGAFASGGGI